MSLDGRELRDEAITRVDSHADDRWKVAAELALADVIKRGVDFTSEDVWTALARTGESTHEPRALGPIILKAIRAGTIARMGFTLAQRPSRHCAPIALYRPVGGSEGLW